MGMKTVFIEDSDQLTVRMFKTRGWDIVLHPDDADLICFTGGPDVSPLISGQIKHHRTMSDPFRDEVCQNLWLIFEDKPFVGICRGAQILNVLNGGLLYQHVEGHMMKDGEFHKVKDVLDGKTYTMTSDHHQMMIPCEDGGYEIILTSNVATLMEKDKPGFDEKDHALEVEALFYDETRSLCFQPHPEWVEKDHECQEYFFQLIDQYLGD